MGLGTIPLSTAARCCSTALIIALVNRFALSIAVLTVLLTDAPWRITPRGATVCSDGVCNDAATAAAARAHLVRFDGVHNVEVDVSTCLELTFTNSPPRLPED